MRFDDRVLRRLKLSDLRLLHAVVERGGMAKAAAQLNISQPAVSKAIAALERTLGVRLLDRNPLGVSATVYGRALLRGGAAAFDELEQSVKQIAFLADPASGELRIGCTEAGAAGYVPTVIDRLSRRYPLVAFQVVTADPATLTRSELPERRIELAIGAIPQLPDKTNIQGEILFDDRHFVMAGGRNRWIRRRRIALSDLVQERWVLPPPDSIMGSFIEEAFRSNGLEIPRKRVVSFSLSLSHHLLASGRFLAMQPVIMARLGRHLPLKLLDVDFAGIPRPVGIMTLKNRTLSPLAELFIEHARALAAPLRTTAISSIDPATAGALPRSPATRSRDTSMRKRSRGW